MNKKKKMLIARSTNHTVLGNTNEAHSLTREPNLGLKQSFETQKDLHNMFPTIDHKKKASSGVANKNGSPGRLVKASYYNSNGNNIGHYKRDYLKMV